MTSKEKQIKDQIEFYFSDSNLLKDKFLSSLINKDENGYVDLNIISNFNRMKKLTKKVKNIIKAIENSDLVELNDDKTKIRRKIPLPENDTSDSIFKIYFLIDRTIYIEHLEGTYDHTTIKAQFSKYGKVNLVSLPRYNVTKDYKGFGFVEFSSEDDAKAALNGLENHELGNITGLSKLDWMKVLLNIY